MEAVRGSTTMVGKAAEAEKATEAKQAVGKMEAVEGGCWGVLTVVVAAETAAGPQTGHCR